MPRPVTERSPSHRAARRPPVGECDLASAWFDRQTIVQLQTTTGQPVVVRYRGRPGHDGPDVVDAVVAIGPTLYHGAVEFHVQASDWHRHGHDTDPRYNGVVLHVVLAADAVTVRQNGTVVPTAPLARLPSSTARSSSIAPCRSRLAAAGVTLLDALGDERFAARIQTFTAAIERVGQDQALYASLLDALGYARNRQPCQQLADQLPLAAVQRTLARPPAAARRITAMALLLGTADLLAEPDRAATGAAEIHEAWQTLGRQPLLQRTAWCLTGVRPANLPHRRLAGLAVLLADLAGRSLADWLTTAVADEPADRWPALLTRLLVVPAPPELPTFWSRAARPASALIGKHRAAIIALNVALPFLGVTQPAAAWEAYRRFPRLTENEVTRHATRQIFGQARSDVVNTARRQQGLQQLIARYCALGLCEKCQPAC